MVFGKKAIEDIDSILYLYFSDYLNVIPKELSAEYSEITRIKRFKRIIKVLIVDFINLFDYIKQIDSSFWIISISRNNYLATKFISDHFARAKQINVKVNRNGNSVNDFMDYVITYRFKFFFNLFFPFFFLRYLKISKNRRKAFGKIDCLFMAHGHYLSATQMLKRNPPKMIIFSNDHLLVTRSILLAARALNIPTVYIQHASVSNYFPPLLFDLVLLEGQNTLDIYSKIGSFKSKVELVGSPKLDQYLREAKAWKSTKSIGIAYNMIDNLTLVEECIRTIIEVLPGYEIIIRPHPNEKRQIKYNHQNISYSIEEDVFAFLSKINMLISGDSSIHLESISLNIPSFYYQFNKDIFDYYNFVKNGLIDQIDSVEVITEKIVHSSIDRINVKSKAKYYNSSLLSEYEGRSSERCLKIIENYASQT